MTCEITKYTSFRILILITLACVILWVYGTDSKVRRIRSIGPVIETLTGKIRGLEGETCSKNKYYKFLGIPFAKPPIGKQRFKNAEPIEYWSGILEAVREKDPCIQSHIAMNGSAIGEVAGSLDCLGINIAIPKLPHPTDEPLPVMIWIHGGAYVFGSGSFDFYRPDNFITNGVIFCTIQYRLGIFGFLSFKDKLLGTPGNTGLKDMILALRWIQDNIHAFGGDPNLITVFSHSAGAASAHLLSVSRQGNGLFHKLISQSGTGLCSWAVQNNTVNRLYAENVLGCKKSEAEKDIFDCINSKTDEELVQTSFKLQNNKTLNSRIIWSPVIEAYRTKESILLEPVADIIRKKKFQSRPTIFGYVSHEGGIFSLYNPKVPLNFTEDFYDQLIPMDLEGRNGIGKQIKEFYYGTKTPSEETRNEYVQCFTDIGFLTNILQTVKLQRKFSSQPTYLFKFNTIYPENFWNSDHPENPLVLHGDDVMLEFRCNFDSSNVSNVEKTKLEKVSQMQVELFTNFAKYSEPESQKLGFSWLPMEKNADNNLVIQPVPYLAKEIEEIDRFKFWDQIYSLVNSNKIL